MQNLPRHIKSGTTYYNIDDLTAYTPESRAYKRIQQLFFSTTINSRSCARTLLTGIYNNKKSSDVVRSVFQNGAMIEGWAVMQSMMLEEGWGNNSPEMELVHDKLKLASWQMLLSTMIFRL